MIDMSEVEERAVDATNDPAGEYLDSIGKYDLSTMSPDEWRQLRKVIVSAYVESVQAQCDTAVAAKGRVSA